MQRASPARRLRITLLCVAFVLSIFVGRLVQLEGLDSARYKTAAEQQLLTQISIPAVRGDIASSDGTILAMTVQTYTVVADPELIPAAQRPAVAGLLAGPLGQPAGAILGMLNHPAGAQYQLLASNVPVAAGDRIQAMQLPGIDMTASYTSSYPTGDLAANIVGFTDPTDAGSLVGEAGLEEEYNSVLAGRPGSEEVEEGTNHVPIPLTEVDQTTAIPAKNLRLTIQADIQYEADQECRLRVLQDHARSCSIIVMTRTGQILAMGQWPTYNPSNVTNLDETTNISVANVFAPGSTMKPVSVAAALEEGGQTPMSVYTIPYQIQVDHDLYTFHDAEYHPTVRYTIAGILAHSSNVGMVQVVQHITPMQQYDYLRAFGLDSQSGLGLPGESPGLLAKPGTPGYYGNNFEYAFGQGLAVTAIQMASVYQTIANGGIRVTPTIVAGTTSATGTFTPAPRPSSTRVIQAKTARELMTILQQVPEIDAQAGEDWGLIPGYPVAAKTGTAQLSDPGLTNCLCQYGSSYIGIAPANNPQLIVAVNIQDPRGKYYGDEVAGPAFFDVMKFALQTMKIPPDYAKTPYIRLVAP
jgi:cell division protein FtsI (penicillin-binding protein 3)